MNATPKQNIRRLYSDLCWLWPIISPPEDYVAEGSEIALAICNATPRKPVSLLHLGCGAGHFDHTLKKHFLVTGVDASPAMLSHARSLNPSLRYLEGDMRSVELDEKFDAVLIADSIHYMTTREELVSAFSTAWKHLNDGGILFTMAEHLAEIFVQQETTSFTRRKGDIEITCVENYYRTGAETCELTMIFIIRDNNGLRVATDNHSLGLFDASVWRELLAHTGFSISEIPGKDNILSFACIKPLRDDFSLRAE